MKPIALDPGNGGRSITLAALQKGDILISTTNGWGSAAIRAITGGGPASHVRLVVGDNFIGAPACIEAVPGAGVQVIALSDAMAGDSVIVAVRYPRLFSAQAVITAAAQCLGASYDYFGAAIDALFKYAGRVVRISYGASSNQFYCSSLIIEVFDETGFPLTLVAPGWTTPNDIVPLQWFGDADYVGHLKYTP